MGLILILMQLHQWKGDQSFTQYLQKSVLWVTLRAEEKEGREIGVNLHFSSRVLLKSQHRFSPKLSCRTEALTGGDGERQVSGSHTVQGDGKPKSPEIWRMCCLATAPTPPALGARMGGSWDVSGATFITAGRAPPPCQWSDVLMPLSSLGPAGSLVIPLKMGWQLCAIWSNWWYFSRLGFR